MLYQYLVVVLPRGDVRTFMYYCVGYGVAVVVVAVTAIVSVVTHKDIYLRDSDICWLVGDPLAMLAFVIPVGLVVIFNFVIMVMAVRIAFRMTKTRYQ